MTLLLAHSVMYKGGLPSRICDAAHTSKFMITTEADGALCMKQASRIVESSNWTKRSLRIQQKLRFHKYNNFKVLNYVIDYLQVRYSQHTIPFKLPWNLDLDFTSCCLLVRAISKLASEVDEGQQEKNELWPGWKKFQLFIITGYTD